MEAYYEKKDLFVSWYIICSFLFVHAPFKLSLTAIIRNHLLQLRAVLPVRVILLKFHQLQKFPTVRTFLSATLQRILPSATPDVISSSTSSSDSNESPSDTQVSPDTYTLTRYDSIYDVPYAKLDYKSYVEEDGDSGHYTLTKDGIPWVGTPGTDQFGDICFSDGRNLYIQCFLSYNDTLSTDFRWFCVNFNHFDDEDSHFLPDETMNKLFYWSRWRDTLHR